ncbi:hypothetical protein D3C72_1827150 [compost metagenome]
MSSIPDRCMPTSWPPSNTPRMIDAMVSPSIQPLALTNWEAGSSSVRMPYLAGEYAAAPSPTTAYAMSGCEPNNIIRQPTTLMALLTNITLPLGSASANAPTKGASTT